MKNALQGGVRGSGGSPLVKMFKLSPEGKMFQGRRTALKYMINVKYPKTKIEEIRDSLKYDGWFEI